MNQTELDVNLCLTERLMWELVRAYPEFDECWYRLTADTCKEIYPMFDLFKHWSTNYRPSKRNNRMIALTHNEFRLTVEYFEDVFQVILCTGTIMLNRISVPANIWLKTRFAILENLVNLVKICETYELPTHA